MSDTKRRQEEVQKIRDRIEQGFLHKRIESNARSQLSKLESSGSKESTVAFAMNKDGRLADRAKAVIKKADAFSRQMICHPPLEEED